jgi:hypothetical protein
MFINLGSCAKSVLTVVTRGNQHYIERVNVRKMVPVLFIEPMKCFYIQKYCDVTGDQTCFISLFVIETSFSRTWPHELSSV